MASVICGKECSYWAIKWRQTSTFDIRPHKTMDKPRHANSHFLQYLQALRPQASETWAGTKHNGPVSPEGDRVYDGHIVSEVVERSWCGNRQGVLTPCFLFPRARCTARPLPVPVPHGLMLTGPERNCFVGMWNVNGFWYNEERANWHHWRGGLSDIPLNEAERQIGCMSGSRCEIGCWAWRWRWIRL